MKKKHRDNAAPVTANYPDDADSSELSNIPGAESSELGNHVLSSQSAGNNHAEAVQEESAATVQTNPKLSPVTSQEDLLKMFFKRDGRNDQEE